MKRRLLTGLLCCCLIFQTAASPVLAAETAGYNTDMPDEGASGEVVLDTGLPDSRTQEEDQDTPQVLSGEESSLEPSEGDFQDENGSGSAEGDFQDENGSGSAEGDSQDENGSGTAGDDYQDENGSGTAGEDTPGESGSGSAGDDSQGEDGSASSEDDTKEIEDSQPVQGENLEEDETKTSDEAGLEQNPDISSDKGDESQTPEEKTGESELMPSDMQSADTERKYTWEEIRKLQALLNGFFEKPVYTNVTPELSDALFPSEHRYNASTQKGWSWKHEDGVKALALTASDSAPEQIYTAVYRDPAYSEVLELPVGLAVSRINKLMLTGDKCLTLSGNYKGSCEIEAVTTGYEVTRKDLEDLLQIEWKSSKGLVSLEAADGNTIKRNIAPVSPGSDTISATILLNGTDTYKKNVTKFTCSYKITVTDQVIADHFDITVLGSDAYTNLKADEDYSLKTDRETDDLSEILIDLDALKNTSDKTGTMDLRIVAQKRSDNKQDEDSKPYEDLDIPASVNWSSSDSGIASVRQTGDQHVLTIRKKGGAAVITATSKDKKKYTQTFIVRVLDYTPIVGTTSFTLNKYRETGEDLNLLAADGSEIIDVKVLEYDSDIKDYTESSLFKTVREEDGKFRLFLDGGETGRITKKKSFNCKLEATVQCGGKDVPNSPMRLNSKIKITVDTARPTATIKAVDKLNIFRLENSEPGSYSISSKYEVEDVIWEPSVDMGDKPYIAQAKKYDPATGRLYLCARNVTKENYTELLRSKYEGKAGYVSFLFKGYKDYSAPVKCTADVVCKADAEYAVEDISVCPGAGTISGILEITDSEDRPVRFHDEDYVEPVTAGVETDLLRNGKIELTYTGTASKTVKVRWESPMYASAVTLSVKVNVLKNVAFAVKNSTVILNTTMKNKVSIPFEIAGCDYPLDEGSFTVTPSPALARLKTSGVVAINQYEEDQRIDIELLTEDEGAWAGDYSLKLKGTVEEGAVKVADKVLTVRIADKMPTVRVTGKGSINLLDRENTKITYKPSFTDISGVVEDVELLGTCADYFAAELGDEGNILVSADESAPLRAGTKYQLKMRLTLDNGYKVTTKAVTVTPKEKFPKLTANMRKATIYRFHPKDMVYQVSVPETSEVRIKDVLMVADKKSVYFDCDYDDDGRVIVALREGGAVKKGTYSLKFQVYYDGMGISSRPATARLSVAVK
ncbi:MAG TPA: hypothetical protein DD414_02745 [Lachnospiraceae bacterium]|nr:hypothetical protein [Lachnospiraceae bacterium]